MKYGYWDKATPSVCHALFPEIVRELSELENIQAIFNNESILDRYEIMISTLADAVSLFVPHEYLDTRNLKLKDFLFQRTYHEGETPEKLAAIFIKSFEVFRSSRFGYSCSLVENGRVEEPGKLLSPSCVGSIFDVIQSSSKSEDSVNDGRSPDFLFEQFFIDMDGDWVPVYQDPSHADLNLLLLQDYEVEYGYHSFKSVFVEPVKK